MTFREPMATPNPRVNRTRYSPRRYRLFCQAEGDQDGC